MYDSLKRLARLCAAVCALLLTISTANAQVAFYHDRASFTAALSKLALTDDYESYPLGPIALGDRRGDFLYSFDDSATQPAVVPGGDGGQALGGSPFDVFVGNDSVTLSYDPVSPDQLRLLRAFGADFLYAPSFDDIPADTYRVGIGDGTAAGQFVGNLDGLDGSGGTFFLGIIADPTVVFTKVNLFSVQLDPAFLVPAYQADNLIYVAVPEPDALTLFALGGVALVARMRRRR